MTRKLVFSRQYCKTKPSHSFTGKRGGLHTLLRADVYKRQTDPTDHYFAIIIERDISLRNRFATRLHNVKGKWLLLYESILHKKRILCASVFLISILRQETALIVCLLSFYISTMTLHAVITALTILILYSESIRTLKIILLITIIEL